MLKTKISALAVLATMGISSMCFATIPDSELYLGGVGINTTNKEVQEMYGDPWALASDGNNHALWRGGIKTYEYGKEKTYKITFNDNKAIQVLTKANNGLETPAGLHVGMSKEDVLDFYKEPDSVQETENVYKWFYQTEDNENKGMSITIDKETEKVKEIIVGYFD